MLVGKPAKNQEQSKYYGTTKCNFEPLKTSVYINQWVTKQRIQEKALLRGTYVKDRLRFQKDEYLDVYKRQPKLRAKALTDMPAKLGKTSSRRTAPG